MTDQIHSRTAGRDCMQATEVLLDRGRYLHSQAIGLALSNLFGYLDRCVEMAGNSVTEKGTMSIGKEMVKSF